MVSRPRSGAMGDWRPESFGSELDRFTGMELDLNGGRAGP